MCVLSLHLNASLRFYSKKKAFIYVQHVEVAEHRAMLPDGWNKACIYCNKAEIVCTLSSQSAL